MQKGYKSIFWGFVFLTFHINIGGLSIIPNFVSYTFICCGIKRLFEEDKIKVLKESTIYCVILSVMSLIIGYKSLENENIFIENPTFHIIWLSVFGILEIIMIYKLFKGSSEILKSKDDILSSTYSKKADIYVILASISLVICNVNVVFLLQSLWTAIGVFEFGLNVWIIILIRKVAKIL